MSLSSEDKKTIPVYEFCQTAIMADRSLYFLVVQPVPIRQVLKSFDSYEEARDFAFRTSYFARVEAHEREGFCRICNGDKMLCNGQK